MTKDGFLKDVATHEMEVIRDDGIYRHIRFKRPGTNCMHFDLVTWPGYLCYVGDMGCYTFTRLRDMFEFFRGECINPSYWSEKVVGADRDGIKEFSREKFIGNMRRWFDEYVEEDATPAMRIAFEELVDTVDHRDMCDHEMYREVIGWEYDGRHPFTDFFEVSAMEYTFRFLWCCHALVWGIAKYDAAMQLRKEPAK